MNIIAPPSKNQYTWFKKALEKNNWFNVAEGGKRASKNVFGVLVFCTLLETHPNKLHLIGGVSIATAKLNILDCDGYGMLNFFENRCRIGQYNNRDCLFVDTKVGQKIVLISGGGKNGDEKLIKGNTYGMAYITEANECHPKFIKEVFDRTMSSDLRKVIHDLNPKSPTHEYYTEVLNFHEEEQKKDKNYGFNYGHFTIADNQSISDEKLKQVLKTYNKNDIWYKRDILGQRIQAEGLIYRLFAEDNKKFMVDDLSDFVINEVRYGVDFGGSGSATAFSAVAIANNYRDVVFLKTERHKEELTPLKLEQLFEEFVDNVYNKYKYIGTTRADSAEQILIRGLKRHCEYTGMPTMVKNALKTLIIDRIRLFNKLMSCGRFWVVSGECEDLVKALNTAIWDAKHPDQRLDNGTTDIDTLDASEYAVEEDSKTLIDNIGE